MIRRIKRSLPLYLFIAFYLTVLYVGKSVCFIYSFSGFPCPSCGLTRANILLFKLDFVGAFNMHPLVLLADVVVAYIILKHLILKIAITKIEIIFIVSILVVFVLTYIIRFIYLYPDIAPFRFNDDAVIARVIRSLSP